MGSSFIHLIRIDSNEFFLMAECTGKTQSVRVEREVEGGIGMGNTCNPWLVHVNVWQKPLQYCKVISFQIIFFKKEFPYHRGAAFTGNFRVHSQGQDLYIYYLMHRWTWFSLGLLPVLVTVPHPKEFLKDFSEVESWFHFCGQDHS